MASIPTTKRAELAAHKARTEVNQHSEVPRSSALCKHLSDRRIKPIEMIYVAKDLGRCSWPHYEAAEPVNYVTVGPLPHHSSAELLPEGRRSTMSIKAVRVKRR